MDFDAHLTAQLNRYIDEVDAGEEISVALDEVVNPAICKMVVDSVHLLNEANGCAGSADYWTDIYCLDFDELAEKLDDGYTLQEVVDEVGEKIADDLAWSEAR